MKLQKLTEQKVILKVDYPTDWVSNIVIVKKAETNDIRICLDPSDLNKAIKRPIYPLPTLEQILP